MTEIRWAAMALADLDAIDLHYRRLDSGLADRIGGQIVRAAAFVGDVPHGGQADDRDRRRWRVAGTPYVVFYRVCSDHVRILRVRHTARNPLR